MTAPRDVKVVAWLSPSGFAMSEVEIRFDDIDTTGWQTLVLQSDAARALADVEAEVGEWKGAWNAAMDDLSRLRENNDELKAALAAATARCDFNERDADRYRWLRDQNLSANALDATLFETVNDDCNPPYRAMKFGTKLDAAIDAALAGKGAITPPGT